MARGIFQDCIYRTDHADEFGVTRSGFFFDSSLAPCALWCSLRHPCKRVLGHPYDCSLVSMECSYLYGTPVGPVTSFEPWTYWIAPDLHGFYKWSWTLALFSTNSSSKSFVIGRPLEFRLGPIGSDKTSLLILINGFARTLSLRPRTWYGSGILVQPALTDAHFRKAWMPYFRCEGHPVGTPQTFMDSVGNHLPQEAFSDMPALTGEELHNAAWPRNPQLVV